MLMNSVYIRKEAIPKLLGLLGKALAEGREKIMLREDEYSDGACYLKYITFKENGDTEEYIDVDVYGGEDPIVTKLPDDLEEYTEEDIKDMEATFECPEVGETDRYDCKHICSLREDCQFKNSVL